LRTDSIFYQLFLYYPGLFFDVVGGSFSDAQKYEFRSVEIKQTAFRIDGLFLPKRQHDPIWFVEVQFQKDPDLYSRLFSEIFLYIRQYASKHDWRAVVIFKKRSLEPQLTDLYRSLLSSEQVQRIYLDQLPQGDPHWTIQILGLIVAPARKAVPKAKQIMDQVQGEKRVRREQQELLELIETIMVYKFPQLSRQELEQMLGLKELKQTKFYQEAHTEGWEEGREQGLEQGLEQGRIKGQQDLLLRLLDHRFGSIDPQLETRGRSLTLNQLEDLGTALLDFVSVADLQAWFELQ
jgi:predicted transposase/invertase (TIGR01784 family)